MSYSRWTTSIWYTYWSADSDSSKGRDGQIFEICTIRPFTYAELKENLRGCVDMAVSIYNAGANPGYGATPSDIDELRGYMKEFMEDIEEKFPDSGLVQASKRAAGETK